MFGKNQTRWYIYTWVLFSTHVWILTHMYGKRHTCVKKATQLYVWKCLAFSTHVWEKPLTCLFPPELSVGSQSDKITNKRYNLNWNYWHIYGMTWLSALTGREKDDQSAETLKRSCLPSLSVQVTSRNMIDKNDKIIWGECSIIVLRLKIYHFLLGPVREGF